MNEIERIRSARETIEQDAENFNLDQPELELEMMTLMKSEIADKLDEIGIITEILGGEIIHNAPDSLFTEAPNRTPVERAKAGLQYANPDHVKAYVNLVDEVAQFLIQNMPEAKLLDAIMHDGIYMAIKGETV